MSGTGAGLVEPADARAPLDHAPRRLLGFAVAGGVLLDVGLRGGVANGLVTAGVLVLVVALLTDRRLESGAARLLAGAAIIPAAFLAVRVSPWLAASNAVAVCVLITLAVGYARTGSPLEVTPRRLLGRAGSCLARGLNGPRAIRPVMPEVSAGAARRFVAVARAVLIAVPILGAVVLLLASGDAVFANLLVPDVDPIPLAGHVLLIPALAVGVLCVAVAASAQPADSVRPGRYGSVEVVTMLALAAAVLGLFVVSQVVALTGAGRRLVESSGLTPAEYARSGFFQLCWAVALLVGFLGLVRALASPEVLERRAVRVLGAVVPLLAVGLVVVSLRRMALYDQAFGLTMLRLWVIGAALWMGALLVMIAIRNGGPGTGRDWVTAGAVAAGFALVVAADLMNPEAFVVRHNVDRATVDRARVDRAAADRAAAGPELDVAYLRELSDDAVPALVEAGVDAIRCEDRLQGAAALNVAAVRAESARRSACAKP